MTIDQPSSNNVNTTLNNEQDTESTENKDQLNIESTESKENENKDQTPNYDQKENKEATTTALRKKMDAIEQYRNSLGDKIILPTSNSRRPIQEIPKFSGLKDEEAGLWLDEVLEAIERSQLPATEQRDFAAARLDGGALFWYRLNRLKIPNMEIFIKQFLAMFGSIQKKETVIKEEMANPQNSAGLREELVEENELESMREELSKLMMERRDKERPSSTTQVLQAAKNEKVKLIPNFSGAENSLNWLKNVQQIGKSLQLDDQQIFELTTIKLNGPAQEWFYLQANEIHDWLSFKQAFLHAFPAPIQPTNIDYLAQLLARKQGEHEPVGKFIQDINRLCLKLDNKITEQDKLQYLRRGLRPQLQHYALSTTSLQEFLTIMQRHEQIEKEKMVNREQSSYNYPRSNQQQQQGFEYPNKPPNYDVQRNQSWNRGLVEDYSSNQNYHSETTKNFNKDSRICYQCNKPGHVQWNCPDKEMYQRQDPQAQQTQQSQQQTSNQQHFPEWRC